MLNPPSITLTPGAASAGPPIVGPQAVTVIVTANGVQPDGSNPGAIDTTTALTLTPLQGAAIAPSVGAGCSIQVDPGNNRRIIITPAILTPGASQQPWSFRVSAAGRTATVTFSGNTLAPLDVSGVAWDGNAPISA